MPRGQCSVRCSVGLGLLLATFASPQCQPIYGKRDLATITLVWLKGLVFMYCRDLGGRPCVKAGFAGCAVLGAGPGIFFFFLTR